MRRKQISDTNALIVKHLMHQFGTEVVLLIVLELLERENQVSGRLGDPNMALRIA